MAKAEKVNVKSLLDSTLVHGDIEIEAGDIVILDKEVADVLIKKGFVKEIKAKEV